MQNTQNQKIWNPSTVAGLSFVFSPAFGSYLLASNWKALGEPEKAASSKIWFFISLVFLVVLAGLSAVFAGNENSRGIVNGVAIVYFIVWYSLSGRLQVKHVKEMFGKTFAKRSFVKPVLIGSVLLVVYIAIVIGLLIATQGAGGDRDHAAGQGGATASSGGPISSLAGMFGSGPKLDCAAPDVKQNITDNYTNPLIESGIPDLIWAVGDGRVKVTVDTIHEVSRNDQSKTVDCAGVLHIAFPQEDLERATKHGEILSAMLQAGHLQPISDPTFTTNMTYQVAAPADEAEKKKGSIVTMLAGNNDDKKLLGTYGVYYVALTYDVPDITTSSANKTPWSKDFKASAIQTCSKNADAALCTCKFDALEKVVGEKDFWRIDFGVQTNPMFGGVVPNFAKYSDALNRQCPASQSVADILGGGDKKVDVAATPASPVVPVSTTAAQQSLQPATQPTPQSAPAQAATPLPAPTPTTTDTPKVPASAIVASFPCDKASSPAEKLICSTPETADADKRLAIAYGAVRAKTSDQAGLKQDQRSWLTSERNACADTACLLRVTESRIQKLSAM
jgi:uncharacterized protein YecT (DUF1311 family)